MDPAIDTANISQTNFNRLKLAAVVLTLFGIALFGYFIYAIGFREILDGIARFGFDGFAVILFIYFARICTRAYAWKLSVYHPYSLTIKDTIPAVVIGEAMSSTIPIGIMVSGTSKALAVRRKIPLVAGLSSIATENLFYSLVTSIFLISGAVVLLSNFAVDETLIVTINVMVGALILLVSLGVLLVIRQWHFASEACEWLYRRGVFRRLLENGRLHVRLFENLIYGFYRQHPRRFLPICLLQAAYHTLGVCEVWFILGRLSDSYPAFMSAFLLESVSRLIAILFKLIPFVIGVDEAGAQFVGETVALAAGVAVTIAIIRKGRMLFWTLVGATLIIKRGLSLRDVLRDHSSQEIAL